MPARRGPLHSLLLIAALMASTARTHPAAAPARAAAGAQAGAAVPRRESAGAEAPRRESAAAGKPAAAARSEELTRLNNLGIAYLAQYKPAEAEKQFSQALALEAKFLAGQVNLGIAQMAQTRYDEAAASFHKALALDPGNTWARFNLSLIFKMQGRTPEALQESLAALQQDPRDADIHYQVGSLHLAARSYEQAIQEFETVLKLDPNFVSAYYGLGRAWIGTGDPEKGRRYVEKHREVQTGSGASQAVGLKYGEQGKYSYAMEEGGAEAPAQTLAAGAVTLVDVSPSSGIDFTHAAALLPEALRPRAARPAPRPGSAPGAQGLRATLAPMLGSGVTVGDVNGDGLEDLFFPNAGAGESPSELYLNQGSMRFERLSGAGAPAVTGSALAAALGDLDGDADADLVVSAMDHVLVFLNVGKGAFADVTTSSGVGETVSKGVLGGVSLADVDHDGDLDIFVAGFLSAPAAGAPGAAARPAEFPGAWPGSTSLLFVNATPAGGAPKFIESAAKMKAAAPGRRAAGAVFSDFDNDRDIDFLLASPADGTTVYSNARNGNFADLGAAAGLPANASILGAAAGDYDKDGWMDLAVTTFDGGQPRLFRNRMSEAGGAGRFALDVGALADVPRQIATPQFGVAFADLDNDGFLDLLAVNGGDVGPALFVYHNDGAGRFSDATAMVGADRLAARHGRGLAVADLDADGDLDVVLAGAGGRPAVLRNDGGNKNHWVRVSPVGLHSNRAGVGAKVEVKSGRLWQKQEVAAGSGYLSQSSLVVHFGLGARERVDTLRLLWPGGVLQDELQVAHDAVLAVKELDRKGSSCPILYAWNGAAMGFVSDFLGGSAVGYRTGAASFNTPDTDEYVLITSEQLRPREGRLELRLVNQLEETIFFDRARLLAVDHPADQEVFPDERLMPAPPFPAFRLFAVTRTRAPAAAWDDAGRDLLDALSTADGRFAGPSALMPFKGYARRSELYLDFGPIPAESPALLLLAGWIDYADSTSNLAASQAGLELVVPYVEALDESAGTDQAAAPVSTGAAGAAIVEARAPGGGSYRGRWVRVLDPMGFPAGLPKTMTADLTGALPQGCRLLRLVTSMRLHWDRIRLATELAGPPPVTALEPDAADLRWRGFPALVASADAAPATYDYDRDEPAVHWKTHVGQFTRYGGVKELLAATDDRYVITRPGDEIALTFDPAGLPPLPAGWRRHWLLHADGFGKDMDLNSAAPDTVDPLPWHGIESYPPASRAASPFASQALLDHLHTYNTRRVPGPFRPISRP